MDGYVSREKNGQIIRSTKQLCMCRHKAWKKYEGEVTDAYAKRSNVNVSQCGICVSRDTPFLGCSPDGLVDSDGIIEIKCPYMAIKLSYLILYTAGNMKITSLTVQHLSITRYIFTQLSELEQCRVKNTCPMFLTLQNRIRTRVLVVESPKLYP